MTSLRDPFTKTFEKGGFTYVQWSQVADRLDEVGVKWTFQIMALGPDWCHGRLTIDGEAYENIGYAENADAEWKHEPLKDAVSDAFKRCAALAGVARYLYDKGAPAARRPSNIPQSPGRVSSTRPERSLTSVPEPDDEVPAEPPWLQKMAGGATTASHAEADNSECPIHNVAWLGSWGDLWHKTDDGKYCRHPENTRQEGRQGARR